MDLNALSETANDRSLMPGAYAGEVTPTETWNYLNDNADGTLVDVRTPVEWSIAGLPNLSSLDKKPITLSWKTFPDYTINGDFASQLQDQTPNTSEPLFFLCKVGGRSLDAACAMTASGYKYCFNIEHGFEGDHNEQQQRGTTNGWKAENLPWEQA